MNPGAIVAIGAATIFGGCLTYGLWRDPIRPWLEEHLWRRDQKRAIGRLEQLIDADLAAKEGELRRQSVDLTAGMIQRALDENYPEFSVRQGPAWDVMAEVMDAWLALPDAEPGAW